MKSIDRLVQDTAGYYVQPVNTNAVFSNVINAYIWGNRRGSRAVTLTPKAARQFLRFALRDPDYSRNIRHRLSEMVDKDKERFSFDSRKMFDTLNDEVREMILILLEEKSLIRDYGDCIASQLLEIDGWTPEYVVAPSLGYPRARLKFTANNPADGPSVTDGYLKLPTPNSNWSLGIATTLMCIDAPRFDADLIPKLENVGRDDLKGLPMGQLKSVILQIVFIMAFGELYLAQAWKLSQAPHTRLFNKAYDLTYAWETSYRPYFEISKRLGTRSQASGAIHSSR
jgi:hypothetical protein